jgi:hypothetical protein
MKTLAGLLTLSLLAACAAGPGASASEHETPPESVPPSEEASGVAAPDGIPSEVWQAILTDLEGRLGAPSDDVSVLTAVAETWSDGSLGCPKDGEMYTQALVDGYQVVVEVAGTEYDYRVGSGTDVRLCEDPPVGG